MNLKGIAEIMAAAVLACLLASEPIPPEPIKPEPIEVILNLPGSDGDALRIRFKAKSEDELPDLVAAGLCELKLKEKVFDREFWCS